jgi:hypothetical protein
MKMKDGLSSLGAVVDHKTKTFIAFFFGQLGAFPEDLSHKFLLRLFYATWAGNMGFGDDQKVQRGLRIYVVKGQKIVVFVYFTGWNIASDYLAEKTVVAHIDNPFFLLCSF